MLRRTNAATSCRLAACASVLRSDCERRFCILSPFSMTTRVMILKGNPAVKAHEMQFHSATRARHVKDLLQCNEDQANISFTGNQDFYRNRTVFEVVRAIAVFSLCSSTFLVQNNQLIMKKLRSTLGPKIFHKAMNLTFYGHFVCGADEEGVKPKLQQCMKTGVNAILYYAAEEDQAANSDKKKVEAVEKYTRNVERFKESIDIVHEATDGTGFIAVKPTALCDPNLLIRLTAIINARMIKDMAIDYGLLSSISPIHRIGSDVRDGNSPGAAVPSLTAADIKDLEGLLSRATSIIQYAAQKGIGVMMDAEQSYFQPAINEVLGVEMMRRFNKNKVVVVNTYQCYLKSAFDTITRDWETSRKHGFKFGARIVRGAYLVQERSLVQQGRHDPINPTYEATTEMYHRVSDTFIDLMTTCPPGDLEVMFATHNEDTVKHILQLLIKKNPPIRSVSFGQLFGMSDYISLYLGELGFPVYKSMPYGPVELVLAYLGRRAVENWGALIKVKKERQLLMQNLIRRATGR